MTNANPLKIAIAGLGTVGGGTVQILQEERDLIQQRCGRAIEIVGISARDRKKKRTHDLSKAQWVDEPAKLAEIPDVEVIVELMGGSEGAAKALVEAALSNGKHVVTANKALIAHHGVALAKIAEKNNVVLAYEAAVAGGIPIIKTLREGLAANRCLRVTGILNGTCNFILTTMWKDKRDFKDVLKEAQAKGYAEADPTFDVEGIDAAHKLAILTALAYGVTPDIDAVFVEGISNITIRDMQLADELGYVIKLLGIAAPNKKGILMRVHPCLVPKLSPIGQVSGAYNAVIVDGHAVGRIALEGAGAGAGATASSVVSDIMDIASGARYRPFTVPVATLKDAKTASMDDLESAYYLRLGVTDRAGVLADITDIFKEEAISLVSFIQHQPSPLGFGLTSGAADEKSVPIILTTHPTEERKMQKALKKIAALKTVVEKPMLLRIEDL